MKTRSRTNSLEKVEEYGSASVDVNSGYVLEEANAEYENGSYDSNFSDIDEHTYGNVLSMEEPMSPKESYTFLREEEIGQLQETDIELVSSLLSISKSAACFLLCHFNWRINKLQEEWFSDEDKVREKAGLLKRMPGLVHRLGNVNCGICYEDYDYLSDQSAECGHPFCEDCWFGYIRTSINDGLGCLMLRCPMPSCSAAVDRDLIRNVLMNRHDDGEIIDKYNRYLLRSYVEKHKQMKWCPGPGCEYAVKVFDEDLTGNGGCYGVSCLCLKNFCWNCAEEVHSPVDCDTVRKWILRNKDESKNADWIVVNTKPCPKCKKPIEKNSGCNIMTCKAPCLERFCWLCLGPPGCKCNRFREIPNESVKKENESDRERKRLRMSLMRYNHYYLRWANNQASKQKAVESLHEAETKHMVQLGSKSIPLTSQTSALEFIIDAWKQIIECRQVIKWTYAYAYYIPEDKNYNMKRQLFEYLQRQAEHSLERLHQSAETRVKEFVEELVPLEQFQDFRRKLIQLTNVTGTYFKKLVTALENGLSEVETS